MIFERDLARLVSKIVQGAKGHHGTASYIEENLCDENAKAWKELKESTIALLAAAKESREDATKRVHVQPRAKSSVLRTGGSASAIMDGQQIVLKETFTYDQMSITHYEYSTETSELVPHHQFPSRKSWVKVYSGSFMHLVKAEPKPQIHVLYMDPPWNIHQGRVKDSKVLTGKEVIFFRLRYFD